MFNKEATIETTIKTITVIMIIVIVMAKFMVIVARTAYTLGVEFRNLVHNTAEEVEIRKVESFVWDVIEKSEKTWDQIITTLPILEIGEQSDVTENHKYFLDLEDLAPEAEADKEYEVPGTEVKTGTIDKEYEEPGIEVETGTIDKEYGGPGTEVETGTHLHELQNIGAEAPDKDEIVEELVTLTFNNSFKEWSETEKLRAKAKENREFVEELQNLPKWYDEDYA